MATIAPEAQAIIDRLARVQLANPVLDRARVEAAIVEHFTRLDVSPLPVRWVTDAKAGYLRVFGLARSAAESAARSAAWSAARSAAESAAESAARSAALDRWIGIWMPFVDAYEAGLWLFFVCAEEVVAVSRPVLHVQAQRLHCATGPAVWWPGSRTKFWFWRGVAVPRAVIEHPERITARQVVDERNVELRRVLLERIGYDRFLDELQAERVQADDYGALYRLRFADDEPVVLLAVDNSTPEPDGSRRRYVLRVPPTMASAREAVAWTFDVPTAEYAPLQQT